MKWTENEDNRLAELISQGKKHSEIAEVFKVTKKSIVNRCFRLNLNIIHYKQYTCCNCKTQFEDLIKSDRKFCSKSCAAIFNSVGRVHSDETKRKIRDKISGHIKSEETIKKISGENNPRWIDGRSIIRRAQMIDGKRKCKHCDEFKVNKKHKMICDDCKMKYYEVYRPACEFKFSVKKYPEEFDLKLIQEHGWYKAANRGNNLGGVSRDHIISVKFGFENGINPEIISHPANCRLMRHAENQVKNSYSGMSIEELEEKIRVWDKKYS